MDWRRPTVEYSAAAASSEPMGENWQGVSVSQAMRGWQPHNPLALGLPTHRDFPQGLGSSGDSCHKTNPSAHNIGRMEYRCVTTSVEGFVQLLAANYLPHGYWFYVTGCMPEGKDPVAIDAKLVAKYGTDLTRQARARRKRLGISSVQYLRYDRFFLLLATHGKHRLFDEEAALVRDIRRVPLRFAGYSISYRRGGRTREGTPDVRWHSHVEIDQKRYRELEAWFLEMAIRRSTAQLALEFYGLPFEPYAPVRRQMLRLLRRVNEVRSRGGLERLPYDVLPLRRRVVRPFAMEGRQARAGRELKRGNSKGIPGAELE